MVRSSWHFQGGIPAIQISLNPGSVSLSVSQMRGTRRIRVRQTSARQIVERIEGSSRSVSTKAISPWSNSWNQPWRFKKKNYRHRKAEKDRNWIWLDTIIILTSKWGVSLQGASWRRALRERVWDHYRQSCVSSLCRHGFLVHPRAALDLTL